MKIRRIFICFIAAICACAFSKAHEQNVDQIKSNPAYITGEGYGNTYNEANNGALQNLIGKIAVSIDNAFTSYETFDQTGNDNNSQTVLQSILNTYSQGTLTNTEVITISESPTFHVMRYIERRELDKIFDQRKEKIEDLIRTGQRAEKKGRIDDALRNYYWAFSLLKSLQYPNEVDYVENGQTMKMNIYLQEQIKDILSGLKVNVIDANDSRATLFFTYKNEPVSSLDFTFFNGNSWTNLCGVEDGVAEIHLRPGVDANSLKIRYEYEYLGETQIDPEIQSVAKIFKGTYFKNSEISLVDGSSSIKSAISKTAKKEQAMHSQAITSLSADEIENSKRLANVMENIIKSVHKGDFNPTRQYFTDEGWDMMVKLLHYGKASLVGTQNYRFFDFGDGRTLCRSLTMSFAFPNNHKTFTEDVVFTFNKEDKIECVAFGLGSQAKKDIFERGERAGWGKREMLELVNFLEIYQTAFALKRLDYIESIFDDNAVIITGHVAKKMNTRPSDGNYNNLSMNDVVTYNKYDKKQYMQKLRRIFASNEFINIRFSETDVEHMGKGGESYGIQLHQDYFSTNYGDTGYLFLLVDINDPQKPIIQVRTWQPDRDPNVNNRLPRNHPDFGLFTGSSF